MFRSTVSGIEKECCSLFTTLDISSIIILLILFTSSLGVSKLENDKVSINILDEGQGFKEKDTNKIFKRFYSNRPDKFGQHSGLGLNIVKNLVDLHNATIRASNRIDKKGASMEIIFPNA